MSYSKYVKPWADNLNRRAKTKMKSLLRKENEYEFMEHSVKFKSSRRSKSKYNYYLIIIAKIIFRRGILSKSEYIGGR